MTHAAALAVSSRLPKAVNLSHGHNWSWAYYETKEDAQKVHHAMSKGGNSKWGFGRAARPQHSVDGLWVVHYHYDNYVTAQVDYDKQKAYNESKG
jgi:hypothetical protein